MNTDIVEVIEIDHNSKFDDDNQDERNCNGINDDSVMQPHLQSDQNEDDIEDVILNDHDMLSNEVLHIEQLDFIFHIYQLSIQLHSYKILLLLFYSCNYKGHEWDYR